MPYSYNRLILAGIEPTPGVGATLTGANDAIRIMDDLQLDPVQLSLEERTQLFPWIGNQRRLAKQRLSAISFSFELAGSGTRGTAPAIGRFFRAAGYGEAVVAATSVTYAPIGSGFESLTIDCHHGGKRHKLIGVRGDLEWDIKNEAIPTGKFSGLGIYSTPTDTANPTVTYPVTQRDPMVINSDNTPTITAFGINSCLESFTFKGGRSPKLHQRAGCTKQIRIDTERKPEGEMVIESNTIATFDYFSAAATQTLGALGWTHGSTAGEIVSFAAATCSLGDIGYDDGDGIELIKLPFMPIPGDTNGYNDHSWIFT
jgi:hypothetical protein